MTAQPALIASEAIALASLMRRKDHIMSLGGSEHAATTLQTAQGLARKGYATLTWPAPRDWALQAAPGPICLATARDVRALLVDAGGMLTARFAFAYRATLEDEYCPFWFGASNYCLAVTRDRTEWQIADVSAPSPAEG